MVLGKGGKRKRDVVDVTEHDDLISAELSADGSVSLSFSPDARLDSEFLDKISNDGHLCCEVVADTDCIMLNLKTKRLHAQNSEPNQLSLRLFKELDHVEESLRKKIMKDSMRILSGLNAVTVDYKEGVKKRHIVSYQLRIPTGKAKTLVLLRSTEKYFYQFKETSPLSDCRFIDVKMQLFYQ